MTDAISTVLPFVDPPAPYVTLIKSGDNFANPSIVLYIEEIFPSLFFGEIPQTKLLTYFLKFLIFS